MISKAAFGKLSDGQTVDIYTLEAMDGAVLQILNYGGILHSIRTPDRAGQLGEITMSYDRLEQYLIKNPYFGALVGRYANRIFGSSFMLDGRKIEVSPNKDILHLHGGYQGFDKVIWQVESFEESASRGLILRYLSADGEEGYPGNLDTRVTYTLYDGNRLEIAYHAVTDQPTVLNLTNHTYFNLGGSCERDVLGHEVMLNADSFTEVDQKVIPTGNLTDVTGTPLDFRTPHPIGERIDQDFEQLTRAGGYDHNWVLNTAGDLSQLAARVLEPQSGRVLELFTTQPGVQFYTGNNLDSTLVGKGGVINRYRHAFCLETQHYPDSPNQPNFPSTVLRPGETYQETTVFKFGVA